MKKLFMKILAYVTIPILIFYISDVAAGTIKFEAAGMHIGDKLTDDFAYSNCPSKDKGEPDINCFKMINVDGVKVTMIFHFLDFKLASVGLGFEPSSFDIIVGAYTKKFGHRPHKKHSEKVKTRIGATYINEFVSWDTDSGIFEISKYGPRIDSGSGILYSKEILDNQKKKESERSNDLSDKL